MQQEPEKAPERVEEELEQYLEGEETGEDGPRADLFDPPGYHDLDGEGPVRPADEDVGVRDKEVDGPRRQVGEAAHNPPAGEAPKEGAQQGAQEGAQQGAQGGEEEGEGS